MVAGARFLASRLRKVLLQSPYLTRTLALVWSAARNWTIVSIVLVIVQGLLPVCTVYATRWLVNAVVAMVRSGGGLQHARPLLLPVVVMAAILLLTEFLAGASAWI